MINDDGIKLEDLSLQILCNGEPIAEIVVDDVQPSTDKSSMRFSAMARAGQYTIQFSAVRRLAESEEEFYNKEGKQP